MRLLRHAALLAAIFYPMACAVLSAQTQFSPEDQRDFSRVFSSSAPSSKLVEAPGTTMKRITERMAAVSKTVTPEKLLKGGGTIGMEGSPEAQLMFWHMMALNATSLDHAPGAVQDANHQPVPQAALEQAGPPRTSRALALIHLAMFEAANGLRLASDEEFQSYFPATAPLKPALPKLRPTPAMQAAAITQSAYEMLMWLYPQLVTALGAEPSGTPACAYSTANLSFTAAYHCALEEAGKTGSKQEIDAGVAYGTAVADRLRSARGTDGSAAMEPSLGSDFKPNAPLTDPETYYQWKVDPVSGLKSALGGRWMEVTPFTLRKADQFRVPDAETPIARYKLKTSLPEKWPSYQALLDYSGETRLNTAGAGPVGPDANLYYIAKFWAYDGTAGLCAPVRLYNQVADAMLIQTGLTQVPAVARYYALLNLAMADAAIASWDSKYHFQLARPVTAIRYQLAKLNAVDTPKAAAARSKAGQPQQQDRVTPEPEVDRREEWFPLGAQVTNGTQTYNITPNFPSYPSGHAVFGGAVFGILRQFAKKPDITIDFMSDELNGKNKDAYNFIRCKDGDMDPNFCTKTAAPESLATGKMRQLTLDCAERENADSRVWMGVHWMFDADDGIVMGNQVARQVFQSALSPVKGGKLNAFEEHTSGRKRDGDFKPVGLLTTPQRKLLLCKDGMVSDVVLDTVTKSYPVAME